MADPLVPALLAACYNGATGSARGAHAILKTIDQADWGISPDNGRSWVVLDLPPGTVRIGIVAQGNWTKDAQPALVLGAVPLELRWFGDRAIGRARVPEVGLNPMVLTADISPHELTYWGSFQPSIVSVSDPVVPATLVEPLPAPPSATSTTGLARIRRYVSAGQIGMAMAEAADIWLGGSAAARMEAARLLIQHFASHPFDRPDNIGALVAMFCMDPSDT